MLTNGSFENGTHRPWPERDNLNVPNDWSFWFAPPDYPNPHDPADYARFNQPEMHVFHYSSLPEDERALFILDGDHCIKVFKGSGAWYGRFTQLVELDPGHYQFTVNLFADLVKGYDNGRKVWADDPHGRDGLVRWWIDGGPQDADWAGLVPGQNNRVWTEYGVNDRDLVEIGVEIMCPFPLVNSGIFADNWTLTPIASECRGTPRIQYPRTVLLLWHGADRYWWVAAANYSVNSGRRFTIGESADDAGLGDLDSRRVIAINPHKWTPALTQAWYDEHYPGVEFIGLRVDFPKDLPAAIEEALDPLPDPPDPTPAPPTVGELGMHQLATQPQGLAEFMALGPPLFKAVDRIDQVIAAYNFTPAHLRAHTRYLYRKYRPDEGDFRYRPDVRAAAREWVNQSGGCADLANELAAAGVPTDRVIYLGPNETWEYDIGKNQKAIDLDFAIIDELIAFNNAHGTRFSYAASSMAVGNPALPSENEDQWFRIVPLARRLRDTAGNGLGEHNCLNTHNYGLCVPDHPEYLAEYAPYLQDRWMEYYSWLKDHDAAIPFVHGEGGHVGGSIESSSVNFSYSPNRRVVPVPQLDIQIVLNKPRVEPSANNRRWLNPGQGWNGLIPPERAIRELLDHFDEPTRAFNAAHGYRASFGLTLFQWGNTTDWAKFDHNPLTAGLITAIRGKYDV